MRTPNPPRSNRQNHATFISPSAVGKERRDSLLEAYDRSGMSGAEFARWAGIKYTTLMGWIGRRRRGAKERPPRLVPEVSWVEAVFENQQPQCRSAQRELAAKSGLSIELPGGAKMQVFNVAGAGLAAEVLRGLGGASQ
jgi:hypothetical protein